MTKSMLERKVRYASIDQFMAVMLIALSIYHTKSSLQSFSNYQFSDLEHEFLKVWQK
jgi:uncharacterized membrane protein